MHTVRPLPTYIINLKSRIDRKAHILDQFKNRSEFSATVIEACEHARGAVGLWNSFLKIIKKASEDEEELVVICEDDHQFTETYSSEMLLNCLSAARKLNADILIGGLSWFRDALQLDENIFWTDKFSATQFIIVFKHFYARILEATFDESDTLDFKLAALTARKFFIHPFISTQKDFGYSDATYINDIQRRVEECFEDSSFNINTLRNVLSFYRSCQIGQKPCDWNQTTENIIMPVYIINLPERDDRRNHILQQFSDKPEFEPTIIPACRHEIGAVGLWQSIRKIIELALPGDDEVIMICEDDHQFTNDYNKSAFFWDIISGHQQGADIMYGGVANFECVVPITPGRYWIYSCRTTQCMIIFRAFFQTILDLPFDDEIVADIALSELSSNKMVFFPFISTQKDFGYSDVTQLHNDNKGIVQVSFAEAQARLHQIREAAMQYLPFD